MGIKMSSLVRRIQRMRKRPTKGAAKRMHGHHFGDMLGVSREVKEKSRPPRGRMRRTKPSKFKNLSSRQAQRGIRK
jgi:hypothetical protein